MNVFAVWPISHNYGDLLRRLRSVYITPDNCIEAFDGYRDVLLEPVGKRRVVHDKQIVPNRIGHLE
jgi:hypothetical protein